MGRERLKAAHQKAVQEWKNCYLMQEFCNIWKVDRQEMYCMCQGNFEDWYKDFIAYLRAEMRYRIETGKYRPIDIHDVWGGSIWKENYI